MPYHLNRHECQTIGLEGPDLAGQRQQELLSGARGTSQDSIQQFDDITFHVASNSRPGSYYEIDLHRATCNCPDFPRARYCKHLAAISVHFPHLYKLEKPSRDPILWEAPDLPKHVHDPNAFWASSPPVSLDKLMEDIRSLSQELDDKINVAEDLDSAVMEALRSVRHTLTAALAVTRGDWALPNREKLPPNQKTWTETAERMGVKCVPKRRLPDEVGLTNWSIGAAKGKRRCIYQDPYAGGERSGKHAKPDARVRPAPLPSTFPPGPLPALVPPMTLPLGVPITFLPVFPPVTFPPGPAPTFAPPVLPFPPPPTPTCPMPSSLPFPLPVPMVLSAPMPPPSVLVFGNGIACPPSSPPPKF